MEIEQLQEYYNKIDLCSLTLVKDADFDYIQSQIAKIAVYTDNMNRTIGEILVESTKLEHNLTDIEFEYELRFTQHMMTNAEVKGLNTGKERKDYINYYLLKEDFRKIGKIKLELKDLASLLDFAKKKARDLDRLFPKLQTLWESIQTEMKYIKKIGSDSHYIENVRNRITEDQKTFKPLFTDQTIELIQLEQYNPSVDARILANIPTFETKKVLNDVVELTVEERFSPAKYSIEESSTTDEEINNLLSDL